jgi:hypothetical protein
MVLAAADALLTDRHDGVMTLTEHGAAASRRQHP